MSFILTNTPSLEECSIISKGIDHENEIHGHHMVPTTAEDLFNNIRHHGGLVARNNETGTVAGMVKLALLDDSLKIYEWGSLLVMPQFRGHKLGHILIRGIVDEFRQKSLIMVTNVPKVIHVSSHDPNQCELKKEDIGLKLLQIVEGPQCLLHNDRIFVNHSMKRRIKDIR